MQKRRQPSEGFNSPGTLRIEILEAQGPCDVPAMLIEGSREDLLRLSERLRYVADEEDCGYELSPRGPGCILFNAASSHGVYVHRIPCTNTGNCVPGRDERSAGGTKAAGAMPIEGVGGA